MEAISPSFSAGSRRLELAGSVAAPLRRLTTAATSRASSAPAAANAPSVTLPLQFILTGIVALLLGMAGLVWRPELLATYHYNQYVIALTHLFVLGWISTIVMGAMYQLVPRSPTSSPIIAAKTTVRFGFGPFIICRAISSTAVTPEASSSAPL